MTQPCQPTRLTPRLMILLVLFALALQGCFHSSGGGGGTADADPTGYYDVSGTASVDDGSGGTLTITDLQGMVNGTRFIAISDANGLVYDGTISDITANDFTASISIFQDGTLVTTASVSGMITTGAKITGTVAGSGLGSGTFELTYALSNNTVTDLSRVENNVNEQWIGLVGGSTASNSALGFTVGTTGDISHIENPEDGVFNVCIIKSGKILPVAGTSFYTVTMNLENCADGNTVNGDYEGLAVTRTENNTDDRLVLVISNSNFSLYGEFIISGIN